MTKGSVTKEINNKIGEFFKAETTEAKVKLRNEIYSTVEKLPFGDSTKMLLNNSFKIWHITSDEYIASGIERYNENQVKSDFLSLLTFVGLSLLED